MSSTVRTVKNNTCIHLRAKGPNIYIYIYIYIHEEKIYKEPPEKYNNRKD
jgi:hypothetical protein